MQSFTSFVLEGDLEKLKKAQASVDKLTDSLKAKGAELQSKLDGNTNWMDTIDALTNGSGKISDVKKFWDYDEYVADAGEEEADMYQEFVIELLKDVSGYQEAYDYAKGN